MDEKPNYYAVIPAEVRYDDSLTANAKLLYGEISSLCNTEGKCWATNSYFADLYGVSQSTISVWISSLAKKGHIRNTIIYKEGTREILNRYLEISKEGYLENSKEGISKNLKENNTSINNTSINKKKYIKKSQEQRHRYGEYSNVLLSDEDMEKLKNEFPNDWGQRIDRLSAYMKSTGKSYKDHLATIRNWARRDGPRKDDPLPVYDTSSNMDVDLDRLKEIRG